MVGDKKQKEWHAALEDVTKITDKLGMPVDKEIAETVAILYLFRFTTISSCGGHLDRINEGPFVIMRSLRASELETQLSNFSDHNDSEYSKLKNEIARHNFFEQERLLGLLDQFYLSYKPTSGRTLTLRTIGYGDFRLNCQGSELAYAENMREKEARLVRNRSEVKAFTDWLKTLYFKSSDFSNFLSQVGSVAPRLFTGELPRELTDVISKMAEMMERKIGVEVDFTYCGSFDGANGGPYILLRSAMAEEVRKTTIAAKGSLTNEKRIELYEAAMKYSIADQQRLYRLLDDFYARRAVNYRRMLEVQTVRYSNFRLRCRGVETTLVKRAEDREDDFKTYYNEMKAFTQYLQDLDF